MAGFPLLDVSFFFPCLREGVEQEEPYWSFVTSKTTWILRSLLTVWANDVDMA